MIEFRGILYKFLLDIISFLTMRFFNCKEGVLMNKFFSNHKSLIIWFTSLALMLVFSNSYAEDTLGSMADNLGKAIQKFETVISWGSYLAGLGFAIGAIMKFKQHKDNPSNIPVGTPMALLFVAVALIFLPSLTQTVGKTMFTKPETGGRDKFFGNS